MKTKLMLFLVSVFFTTQLLGQGGHKILLDEYAYENEGVGKVLVQAERCVIRLEQKNNEMLLSIETKTQEGRKFGDHINTNLILLKGKEIDLLKELVLEYKEMEKLQNNNATTRENRMYSTNQSTTITAIQSVSIVGANIKKEVVLDAKEFELFEYSVSYSDNGLKFDISGMNIGDQIVQKSSILLDKKHIQKLSSLIEKGDFDENYNLMRKSIAFRN